MNTCHHLNKSSANGPKPDSFLKKFIAHHIGYQLVYIYINRQNSKKIQLDFNWILNLVPCVPFNFNFVPSELLSVKIEEFKSI